ncbi:MAG: hypothetical protein GY906_30110 [bacterium]|nr:hypothetical protein [bacterium]
MSRIRKKAFWPQAAGLTPGSTATDVVSVLSDDNIVAGDTAIVTPANIAAGALMGNALGLFAVCTTGACTITHAAAAGGEQFHVVVIPQGMID